jgi:hypothetical protein
MLCVGMPSSTLGVVCSASRSLGRGRGASGRAWPPFGSSSFTKIGVSRSRLTNGGRSSTSGPTCRAPSSSALDPSPARYLFENPVSDRPPGTILLIEGVEAAPPFSGPVDASGLVRGRFAMVDDARFGFVSEKSRADRRCRRGRSPRDGTNPIAPSDRVSERTQLAPLASRRNEPNRAKRPRDGTNPIAPSDRVTNASRV